MSIPSSGTRSPETLSAVISASKVLKAEGVTEIDCVVVHIENPQDEKALNMALNKAVGEWEPVALADLLSELQRIRL